PAFGPKANTPLSSTVARTRGVVAAADLATLVVPASALYPAITNSRPSAESVKLPSEVAVPLLTTAEAPLLGILIVCTKTPARVYSSRKTGLAALVSAAEPSPTRSMTRSPGVNGAANAVKTEVSAIKAESVNSRFIG